MSDEVEAQVFYDPETNEFMSVNQDMMDLVDGPVSSNDRASTVEFCLKGQVWVSRLLDGRELCCGLDRPEVVRVEHQIIEEMIAGGEKIPRKGVVSFVLSKINKALGKKHPRHRTICQKF